MIAKLTGIDDQRELTHDIKIHCKTIVITSLLLYTWTDRSMKWKSDYRNESILNITNTFAITVQNPIQNLERGVHDYKSSI